MTDITFHIDEATVPPQSQSNGIDVLLYGPSAPRSGMGSAGHRVELAVKRLGISIDPVAFDFLTIALAVITSDTFVDRASHSGNGWARNLALTIPVAKPSVWQSVGTELEKTLDFLSGDKWTLTFASGGKRPPTTEEALRHYRTHLNLAGVDCVSLFSGGLDSMIGVRNLITSGKTPLLISHSYRGDKTYQELVAPKLGKLLPRFAANANPVFKGRNVNDTSMRTRSLGFLAYGIAAASALSAARASTGQITLYVPENGFIALNAPLTRRRIGSHSTRTTHPHFLESVQSILDTVGLPVKLENEYRHKTKGEMLVDLDPDPAMTETALSTVSCGKWKRRSRQCGHCVPCIIRRAAFHNADITDTTSYRYELHEAWEKPHLRDDVMAMLLSCQQGATPQLAIASGPLPLEASERSGWLEVHERGLAEVQAYLKSKGFKV